MDFSTILKADESARSHGREEKEERKEEKGLPQASAASSALIFDEHEYERSRLQWKKSRDQARRSSVESLKGEKEDFIGELSYPKPDSMGPISPGSEGKKTPVMSLPPPVGSVLGSPKFAWPKSPMGWAVTIFDLETLKLPTSHYDKLLLPFCLINKRIWGRLGGFDGCSYRFLMLLYLISWHSRTWRFSKHLFKLFRPLRHTGYTSYYHREFILKFH